MLPLGLAASLALPLAAPAKKAPPTPGPVSTATMPSCSAADPVVWVNTSSKVYHAQGTPWFGRTAHGMYACTSQAVAAGARPAGMHGKSKMAPASMEPSPMATGKKRHKKGSGTSTSTPAASPTPK